VRPTATANDVIESCKIVQHVIGNCLDDMPKMINDRRVQKRKEQLIAEATLLIGAIEDLADDLVDDPLSDVTTLAKAVRIGLFDAPHLAGNCTAMGTLQTRIIDGACLSVDPYTGEPMDEQSRMDSLL